MLSWSFCAAQKPAPEVRMDESRRIWRDRVARWHKSGQSARVFAEQGGSAGMLYSWNRRLGMKRSEYRQGSEKATLMLREMHDEYFDALANGRIWKSRWARAVYCWSVARNVCQCFGFSLLDGVVRVFKTLT
jgi:hypothetical protein